MRLLAGLAAAMVAAAGAPSALPVASFTANPLSGPPSLSVDVDASASADPDGMIVAYDWDFGDLTTGSGVTTTHVYAVTGTYRIKLTVTDDAGDTASTTIDVDCISATNLPPLQTIGAFPSSGTAPLLLQVESLVHDDAGTHAEIWDAGDGSPPVTFTNVLNHAGTLITVTYATPGTYTVVNRAIDPEGIWREKTAIVTVTAPPVSGYELGRRRCGHTGMEAAILIGLLFLMRRVVR